MNKFGLATILENFEVGYQFSPDNIPLHLTHIDSFQTELNAFQLEDLLRSTLAEQSPFKVKAVKDAFYGPNKDILVTELEVTPQLQIFHALLMDMLDSAGAVLKNPQFHREGFSPHISAYDTRRIKIGDTITIDHISFAEKVSADAEADTKILATVKIGIGLSN